MNIVWHGNYIKYMEAARSHFCLKHSIDAKDFIQAGLIVPVSKVDGKYKSPLFYQDRITVKAICYYQEDPKLVFHYKIYRESDNELVFTGKTEQLFLDMDKNLFFEQPGIIREFYQKMKIDH
jgi:acyl-CoA thioester hydrolase